MTLRFLNRMRMSVVGTPGTGSVTLGSAPSGFRTAAAAGAVNGDKFPYVIEDIGGAWEYGYGTYTSAGTSMARTRIASSTGALLSLTSAAIVYCDLFGEALAPPLLSVKLYGAVGNGVADDTAAIQAAINDAISLGAIVYLPGGTYNISSALTVANPCEIIGAGIGVSKISLTNTTQNGFLITSALEVHIHDLDIMAGGSQTAGDAININATSGLNKHSRFHNIMFNGVDSGIHSVNATRCSIRDCTFTGFTDTAISWFNHNSADGGDNTFYGNEIIGGAGTIGIVLHSGSGFIIVANKFNSVDYGIFVNTNTAGFPGAGFMSDILIAENSIENAGIGSVVFSQADSTVLSNAQVNGNQFTQSGNISAVQVNATASATWLNGLQVNSNIITYTAAAASAPAISIDGAKVCTVVGNVINGNGSTVAVGLSLGSHTTNGKSSQNVTANVTTAFSNPSAVPWTNT